MSSIKQDPHVYILKRTRRCKYVLLERFFPKYITTHIQKCVHTRINQLNQTLSCMQALSKLVNACGYI